MATAYIGTSAFAEAAWRGAFYPPDLPEGEYLSFYASRLAAVEVNSTFYGLPRRDTLRRWAESVPASFRFSLKAPRYITHQQPLERAEPVAAFLQAGAALGSLAGPPLFLLPPWLPAGRGRLRGFLERLPAGLRVAFEFRHPTWHAAEIQEMLQAAGAARCGTDAGPAPGEPLPGAGFVYLRLRRDAYTPEEIGEWARRIAGWLAGGFDVFCYLKHDQSRRGPDLALALDTAVRRGGVVEAVPAAAVPAAGAPAAAPPRPS